MKTPTRISRLAILALFLLFLPQNVMFSRDSAPFLPFLPQNAAASPIASATPQTAASPIASVTPQTAASATPQTTASAIAQNSASATAQNSASVAPQTAAIDAKLAEYLSAIDALDIPAACAEVDFLISSVQEEALRNTVAQRAYFHFRDSKIMGSENIAIHIYDRWFADYTALFDDLDQFEQAGIYAYVNRASLIGAQAQSLTLTDTEGEEITLPKPGRKAVIFFYSATCPKCLLTSVALRSFLSGKKSPDPLKTTKIKAGKTDFFAIYAGDDDAQWAEYTRKYLNLKSSCKSKAYHLKAEGSDFVTAYGVVQTPRLFLVGEDGRIIGRNLDVPALRILMKK